MTGADTLVAMDVAARADRLRAEFGALELDAMLVTKPVNVRWLTGFTGSSATVLVTPHELTLVTDGRYEEQADDELAASGVEGAVVIDREPFAALATTGAGGERLGFESHHLTVDAASRLDGAGVATTTVASGSVIDRLRRVKDAGEQARLRAAAGIADAALAEIGPAVIAGGLTEREAARALEAAMFANGAHGLSFETIVASGPNSARPHARPSDRIIAAGDLVVIDFGAAVDGYGSDMTRTLVCGGDPTPDQVALYDAVAAAQAEGVAAVRAGVDESSIDATCRTTLAGTRVAGTDLADAFVHGTGHGIGLEIHEEPVLSARSVGILLADLVVTVEPGAYLPAFGGVRVEDSVVVTADGCDPITHSPKGLVPWPLSRPTT